MKTRRTTMEIIADSIKEGYTLLDARALNEELRSYDNAVEKYRAEGYDVRAWYVKEANGQRGYVIYGRLKKRVRTAKTTVKKINYTTLNTKELKELCKKNNISGYYKMKKDEMIKALSEKGE